MFSKHQNIKFSVELEDLGSLPFLDVKICNETCKLVASVYRKQASTNQTSYQRTKIEDF